MAGLDTFLRLHNRRMSDRVVIVEITDEDYADPNLFAGKSPLSSKQLINLVANIQKYDPAVIAMDFDTDSGDWCKLKPDDLAKILPEQQNPRGVPQHPPVVWAEIPENTEQPLRLRPVLGGSLGGAPGDVNFVGLPRFPVDFDGVVRRYEGKFLVTGSMGSCAASASENAHVPDEKPQLKAPEERDHVPSFARATINAVCKSGKIDCSSLSPESERPVIFNFYGDRYRFPIIQSHEFIGAEARTKSGEADTGADPGPLPQLNVRPLKIIANGCFAKRSCWSVEISAPLETSIRPPWGPWLASN